MEEMDRGGTWAATTAATAGGKTLQLYKGLSKETTDRCPCGMGPQTVEHELRHCDRHDALRATTWDGREHIPRRFKGFLAVPENARRSASFMVGTGLLRALSPANSSGPGDTERESTDTVHP